MGITIAQALQIGVLQRAQILAGHAGLRRTVEHVSVLEIPLRTDPRWYRDQELYITNFFGIGDDQQGLLLTIDTLAQRHSAGLVYQATSAGSLFRGALDLADLLAFPVIEVPPDIAYNEIITPITAMILNKHIDMLEQSQALQRQLVDLLLRGFGVEQLTRAIADQLRQPVMLLNTHGGIAAAARLDEQQQRHWQRIATQAGTERPQIIAIDGPRVSGAHIFVHPLSGGNRCVGWLAIGYDEDAGDRLRAVVDQAVGLLTLELIKYETIAPSRHSLQRDFLEELLSGHRQSDEQLLREAARIGWDLQRCRAVLVVRSSTPALAPGGPRRASSPVRQIDDLIRQISPTSIVCQRGDDVLVLVNIGNPQAGGSELHALAQSLHRALVEAGHRQCIIASGSAVQSLSSLATSYQEALGALRVRHQLPGAPPVVTYDDAQLLILLSDFGERTEVQSWLRTQLGALIDYDRRNKTNLVQTLEAALDQGGLINVTADLLNIHPNTLKYRLQRIEEILSHSPLSSTYRLTYHIATKLARLLSS